MTQMASAVELLPYRVKLSYGYDYFWARDDEGAWRYMRESHSRTPINALEFLVTHQPPQWKKMPVV
jgi:hypothetical protein